MKKFRSVLLVTLALCLSGSQAFGSALPDYPPADPFGPSPYGPAIEPIWQAIAAGNLEPLYAQGFNPSVKQLNDFQDTLKGFVSRPGTNPTDVMQTFRWAFQTTTPAQDALYAQNLDNQLYDLAVVKGEVAPTAPVAPAHLTPSKVLIDMKQDFDAAVKQVPNSGLNVRNWNGMQRQVLTILSDTTLPPAVKRDQIKDAFRIAAGNPPRIDPTNAFMPNPKWDVWDLFQVNLLHYLSQLPQQSPQQILDRIEPIFATAGEPPASWNRFKGPLLGILKNDKFTALKKYEEAEKAYQRTIAGKDPKGGPGIPRGPKWRAWYTIAPYLMPLLQEL